MHPIPTFRVDARGVRADAAEIDSLARLALRLRRCGYRLELLQPSDELLALIELCGLSQALGADRLRPGSTEPRC
jgi:ABC-type transporter Mla MlaB component